MNLHKIEEINTNIKILKDEKKKDGSAGIGAGTKNFTVGEGNSSKIPAQTEVKDTGLKMQEEEPPVPMQEKRIIGGRANLHISPTRIAVMGVGGGGVNAVSSMTALSSQHVDLWVANTDLQTLYNCPVERQVVLGSKSNNGLGVGGDPSRGAEAAREVQDELTTLFSEYDMIFLATGLGGGTGTGAIPVMAKIARDLGILVVSVVTMPFHYEGEHRLRNAENGLDELEEYTDALIVVPNNSLVSTSEARGDILVEDSFSSSNRILSNTVFSITDILTMPGRINIDFADIKACLKNSGLISVGSGESSIEESHGGNAHRATDMALKNNLLSEENAEVLSYADNIIINVVGGKTFTMQEYAAIPDIISSHTNIKHTNLKQGYRYEETWEHRVHVTIIASSNLKKKGGLTTEAAESKMLSQNSHNSVSGRGLVAARGQSGEKSFRSYKENEIEEKGYISTDHFTSMLNKTDKEIGDIFNDEIKNNNSALSRYSDFLRKKSNHSYS